MDKINYGECKSCGAELVRNPKTGKIFCSQKCWLNNPAPQSQLPPSPKIPLEPKIVKGPDEPDWDSIKSEEHKKQNHLGARRDAIQIVIQNSKFTNEPITIEQVEIWTAKIEKT